MNRKKAQLQAGKTYAIKNASSTYTIIVGDLSESTGSESTDSSSSNLHVGVGAPAPGLGKIGGIYLDSLNKRVYVKDFIGWDSGFEMGSTGAAPEFKVGIGAPTTSLSSSINAYIDIQSMMVHTRSGGNWDTGRMMKGSDGSHGRSVRFGNGPPVSSLGVDDETYIDLSDFKIHTKSAGAWSAGSVFKGNNGQNGKSLRFGNGLPSNSDGEDDEVYLDLDNFKIHTKSSGAWSTGNLFKGNDGSNGLDGKSLRFGNGIPSDSLGDDNEVYLDLDNFKLHTKSTGFWDSGSAFKGNDGLNGARGKTTLEGEGPPGTGAHYASASSELQAALSDAGLTLSALENGDVYLDTLNHVFYKKTSLGWSARGNSFKPKSFKGVLSSLSDSGDDGDTAIYDSKIYKRVGGSWVDQSVSVKGDKGDAGSKGEKGIDGANGLRGKVTLEGSGAPGTGTNLATPTSALTDALSDAGLTSGDLDIGDIYLDTSNHRFYKKTSSGWVARGATFMGPVGATGPQGLKGDGGDKGIDGTDGLRGKITLEGGGAPGAGSNLATPTSALTDALSDAGLTVSDLEAGDLYVDTTNHRFYKKTSLGWTIRGVTFKGDVGATGPQGIKGDAGSTGATGPQGLKGDAGATGATGPQGVKGDGIDRYADSLATDVLLSSGIEKQLYYGDLISDIGSFLTETGDSTAGSTFTIDTGGRYRIDVVFGFKAVYPTNTITSVNYTAKLLINDYVKKTASSSSSSISATTKYPSIELSWIGFLPATSTIKCKVSRDNSNSNVTLYANAIDKADLTGEQEDTTITITKL